jgi:hypothetical protein
VSSIVSGFFFVVRRVTVFLATGFVAAASVVFLGISDLLGRRMVLCDSLRPDPAPVLPRG